MSLPTLADRYQCAPHAPGAAIVTRDGLPVIVTDRPEAYLHAATPSSVEWATTHEGWAIVRAPEGVTPTDRTVAGNVWSGDLRGAHAFVTMAARRGYGMTGRGVRLAVQAVDLAADLTTEPDYLAASDILAPLASAAVASLNYWDGDAACIRHMVDAAIRAAAIRGGLTADEAEAL